MLRWSLQNVYIYRPQKREKMAYRYDAKADHPKKKILKQKIEKNIYYVALGIKENKKIRMFFTSQEKVLDISKLSQKHLKILLQRFKTNPHQTGDKFIPAWTLQNIFHRFKKYQM